MPLINWPKVQRFFNKSVLILFGVVQGVFLSDKVTGVSDNPWWMVLTPLVIFILYVFLLRWRRVITSDYLQDPEFRAQVEEKTFGKVIAPPEEK